MLHLQRRVRPTDSNWVQPMFSRDHIYWKFGMASEAAQLLETELGNLLLGHQASSEGLVASPNPERAKEILNKINKSTLGRLVRSLGDSEAAVPELEGQLDHALSE